MKVLRSDSDSAATACYLLGFPRVDERVTVTRRSGRTMTARIALKPDALFRDSGNLHWLTDDDKLADVAFDPIVSWNRQHVGVYLEGE